MVDIVSTKHRVYQKIEATFTLNHSYQNPFDPNEIQVDAQILLPDSNAHLIPCFYLEPADYDPGAHDWIVKTDQGTWMLRYSAMIPGDYRLTINVTDFEGQSKSENYFSTGSGSNAHLHCKDPEVTFR